MRNLILIILLTISVFGAETAQQFADPKPSFDNPRKWVIKLRKNNLDDVNHMLGSIYNVLAVYPPEAIQIAVITYAKGVRTLKKDYDVKTLARIKSLMDYDVEFIVCRNTMDTMKWTDEDFIDGVSFVRAGIAEVIERQAGGWIGVTPY